MYSALPKLVNADGVAIFFPQMLGVFLAAIYVVLKQPKAYGDGKSWKATIVGVIFSLAKICLYIFS